MSYALRTYRHRNANGNEKEQQSSGGTFFHHAATDNGKPGPSSFFQAKMSVNKPGDVYEQEADSVASSVVNQSRNATPMVQQKKISGIQRLATEEQEEKKTATNEERMRLDKEIQQKPEEEKEKEVQTKGGAGASSASPQLSSKIEQSAGGGRQLSDKTLTTMQSSFGLDFSDVSIHTDAQSVEMNKELGAQAFTHGKDIYFNAGKYNPETSEGKFLLAHELTHVVQQNSNGPSSSNITQ